MPHNKPKKRKRLTHRQLALQNIDRAVHCMTIGMWFGPKGTDPKPSPIPQSFITETLRRGFHHARKVRIRRAS